MDAISLRRAVPNPASVEEILQAYHSSIDRELIQPVLDMLDRPGLILIDPIIMPGLSPGPGRRSYGIFPCIFIRSPLLAYTEATINQDRRLDFSTFSPTNYVYEDPTISDLANEIHRWFSRNWQMLREHGISHETHGPKPEGPYRGKEWSQCKYVEAFQGKLSLTEMWL